MSAAQKQEETQKKEMSDTKKRFIRAMQRLAIISKFARKCGIEFDHLELDLLKFCLRRRQ